tara:strand:- start:301 stop:951 length:651 start_codon:yes stop_codon:yes gene_type:complete
MPKELIEKTRLHIEEFFSGEASGHDWPHVQRVWKMARTLAKKEGADETVVELAALLHDIADWKFHNGDESKGPERGRQWLTENHAPNNIIQAVCEIIATISYKGAGVPTPMKTLEGKVVQDADRLDAIGAVGIARAFAYGGFKGRAIYHPNEPPTPHQSFEDYKKNKGHTINHFYEKLLLLRDRMNTESGRQMAQQRHQFMKNYLEQFYQEWKGDR